MKLIIWADCLFRKHVSKAKMKTEYIPECGKTHETWFEGYKLNENEKWNEKCLFSNTQEFLHNIFIKF